MNSTALHSLSKIRRGVLLVAGVALIVAALSAWFQPNAILPAYRLAVFVCLAPAIGSLLFALIHRSTGGNWGDALQPFLAAGCGLAPWLWLLIVPLLFFAPASAAAASAYDSRLMLGLRTAFYAVIFVGIALALLARKTAAAPWVGPAGLIVIVFTLHFLADDWLTALDPGWHSTAFPLVWMLGQAVAGLGCAVLAALLCGISPHRSSSTAPRSLGLDWGNLLLTAVLLWCYVTFAQFLIIWGGNLPREISWFTRRSHGGWAFLPGMLALLHFVVPLAILLSRRFKQSTVALGLAALTVTVAQILFLAWMILPAFDARGAIGSLLAVALTIGAAALFFHRYLGIAVRRLQIS